MIGQFVLAGQGYLQIGFVMLAPIFLILMTGVWSQWRLYLVRAVQAIAIGLLIPAVFLFPFLRYYSRFSKPTDPAFLSHQPFHFLTLNLVINDWDFMRTDGMLGKQSMPGLYVNYVGWAVIIFAVAGGYVLWQRSRPTALVLFLVAVGALWIGSGAPFQLMARDWAPLARPRFCSFDSQPDVYRRNCRTRDHRNGCSRDRCWSSLVFGISANDIAGWKAWLDSDR